MPLSPRTLRPATNFTPRSITGLALWLDASDASTLFQDAAATTPATATSDPVGAWLDKSGNARHATQSVSASRPTVGSSSKSGKNAVRNNGTGSVALQVAAWPYTAGNTQFAVFNASAINQGIYQRGSLNDEPRMAIQTGANGVASVRATRGGSVLAQTHSEVGYALSQWSIGGTLFNTALGRAYRDGVYGADTTDSQTFSGDQELRLLSLPGNIYGINGGIAEFLYYDRQLTATEVSRVAAYLSRRWGITLAPQVSNADAQDWINRVYANGGTVSSSTAAAVSTFCDAIDAAGIRDRFYRLNLFCGGTSGTTAGLAACLVPLYCGPSLSGTQYGNATDTNVGPFVVGDYSETLGLLGGGSKWLDTGFKPQTAGMTASSVHLSAVWPTFTQGASTNVFPVSMINAAVNERHWLNVNSNTVPTTEVGSLAGGNGTVIINYQIAASNGGVTIPGGLWAVSRVSLSDARLFSGAAQRAANTSALSSVFGTENLSVYARWNGSTTFGHFSQRMMSYSAGLGMTDAQVAAFNTAITNFNAAMGRNV